MTGLEVGAMGKDCVRWGMETACIYRREKLVRSCRWGVGSVYTCVYGRQTVS